MYVFLLVLAICSGSALSQIRVPCYGEGCNNVTVYLGPRWGSRVIIMPKAEDGSAGTPSEGSGDSEVPRRPQHRPVPPGDVFRVDLTDDEPIGELTTRHPSHSNSWVWPNGRRWLSTTGRPWSNRIPNDSVSEFRITVDNSGTLDLSWRGYTGEDVKRFLNSLSQYDRARVKRLLLDGNIISSLPAMVFPVEFEYHLQELSLNNNPISVSSLYGSTRFELSRMAHLETLNMTNCGLTTFMMPNLPSLQNLDLSYNRLTDLPYNLERSSSLVQLSLRGNRISYVDDSISALSELVLLDLGSNGVREFWGEPLRNLRSLVTLKLDNNLLTTVPQLDPSRSKYLTLDNNTLECSCYLMDWVQMKYGDFHYDYFARCQDGPRSVFLDELKVDVDHPGPRRFLHLCDEGWWGARAGAAIATWCRYNPDILAVAYKIVGVSILLAVLVFLLRKKKRGVAGRGKPRGIPYNILDEQRVSTVSGPHVDV